MPDDVGREEAVRIAQERVQTDAVMSLADRQAVVAEEDDAWHVSFVSTNPKLRGGEPHVRISRRDGSILEVFYTQ